jgi:hypothetical protein
MPVPASWTVEDIGAAFVVKGTRQKPAMTFLFLEGVPFSNGGRGENLIAECIRQCHQRTPTGAMFRCIVFKSKARRPSTVCKITSSINPRAPVAVNEYQAR